MDNDEPNEPASAARRMLAALTAYRHHVDRLQHGWENESYKEATDLFAQIRGHAALLPEVHLAWLQVLVSRFEFAQAVWELRTNPAARELVAHCHAKHAEAIVLLHERCLDAYCAR